MTRTSVDQRVGCVLTMAVLGSGGVLTNFTLFKFVSDDAAIRLRLLFTITCITQQQVRW